MTKKELLKAIDEAQVDYDEAADLLSSLQARMEDGDYDPDGEDEVENEEEDDEE